MASHLLLVALCTLSTVAQEVMQVSPPARVPNNASPAVTKGYLSIMVETTSWAWYGGQAFSATLIENLVSHTRAFNIRMGSTSGNHSWLDPSQTANVIRDDPSNTSLLANLTLGQPWLRGFDVLRGTPHGPNVRFVLQVPLARKPMSKAVQFAVDAVANITTDRLDALEIGNEPDLYSNQVNTPKPYSCAIYTTNFDAYTAAISTHLPTVWYQVTSLADGYLASWSAQAVFEGEGAGKVGLGGTLDANQKAKLATFARHYYQARLRDGPTLHGRYLDHTVTLAKFAHLADDIAYVQQATAAHPSLPFVLAEAGSALGPVGSNDGGWEAGINRSLGSALWAVDFLLQGMASGVARVNMNQCSHCNFARWWASQRENIVHSQYSALVLVADWMQGVAGGASPFRVAPLFDAAARPKVSSYAGYVGGALDRVVVIDLNESNATATRVERDFQVAVPAGVVGAELRRLTGGGTYSNAEDMVYAGMRCSVANPKGLKVGTETEVLGVSGGKVSLKMKASEAVLVKLRR